MIPQPEIYMAAAEADIKLRDAARAAGRAARRDQRSLVATKNTIAREMQSAFEAGWDAEDEKIREEEREKKREAVQAELMTRLTHGGPTNDERASLADEVLGHFMELTGAAPEEAITDLICDLLHLTKREQNAEGYPTVNEVIRRGIAGFVMESRWPPDGMGPSGWDLITDVRVREYNGTKYMGDYVDLDNIKPVHPQGVKDGSTAATDEPAKEELTALEAGLLRLAETRVNLEWLQDEHITREYSLGYAALIMSNAGPENYDALTLAKLMETTGSFQTKSHKISWKKEGQ